MFPLGHVGMALLAAGIATQLFLFAFVVGRDRSPDLPPWNRNRLQ